jgi:RNA polymerase sigma factor (sigma-70 family)
MAPDRGARCGIPPTLGRALHVRIMMGTDSANRDPHALLAHAAWLRRLARSLVGDGAAADDLVQETWVAALRRPPDASRPLRPWLRRVLENAARFRWRGETNRATREAHVAALADDATPSSDELLARHEAQQLLARLVGELGEPYRSTILLRYAEGLEPTEIAHRQGIPAGTVRWRLTEGLARLRAQLDDTHSGDRRAWMIVLGPLAMPRGAAAGSGAGATGGWRVGARRRRGGARRRARRDRVDRVAVIVGRQRTRRRARRRRGARGRGERTGGVVGRRSMRTRVCGSSRRGRRPGGSRKKAPRRVGSPAASSTTARRWRARWCG